MRIKNGMSQSKEYVTKHKQSYNFKVHRPFHNNNNNNNNNNDDDDDLYSTVSTGYPTALYNI